MHNVTSLLRLVAILSALAFGSFPLSAHAQARPMIEHIEPTSGPPGTHVSIVGRGFRSSARVLFNEHEVPLLERLPERLTVALPAGAQTGSFVVAHGDDEVESEVFHVTAAEPPPRVDGIQPISASPGTEVVIRGQNFAARLPENQVHMGSLPMVVRSGDPLSLRVIVPEGAVTGPMQVHTAGGDVLTPMLTVTARVVVRDFTPTGAAPGGHVVIRGAGFGPNAADNRVTVGGRAVRVVRASPTEIEVEIPRDAQQGGSIVVDVTGAGRFETGAALLVAPAPLIASIDPPQAAMGANVTLRGHRFGVDASAVHALLGTVEAHVVTVGPDALVVQVPRGSASGRWSVTVAGIGPVQASTDFTVLAPVTVASFEPRSGDAGDHVTLTGTGFSATVANDTVKIGTIIARVISATPTQLVVEIPPSRSGQWLVTVQGNGEARSVDPFMVTRRPHIVSFEPAEGVAGDQVTLHGDNFPGDRALVQVRLQDVDCEVQSTAHDTIVVTVPRGLQAGPATFSVIARLQGTGHATSAFRLLVPTQITSLDPAAAPAGAHVVIHGEGFETDAHALHVRYGATAVRPVRASATAIEFVVPAHAQSADVTVEAAGRRTATSAFRVQTPPVVQSFAPLHGAAGAQVTLRGRDFGSDAAAVSVVLGEAACTVGTVTPTSVVVTVPEHAATGRFTVRVHDQGEGRAARDFTVAP